MFKKTGLGKSVYKAAIDRINFTFDNFQKVYVSFSGGKDSSVMLHMVMQEAIKRKRRVGILFVDLEAQYKLTIDHVSEMKEKYKEYSDFYWVCLPIHLRNAVSQYQSHWICWDKEAKKDWVRDYPTDCICDESYFPFFRKGMEFEEFVPLFGEWYSDGSLTACLVGIRSDESLNRWRTIASEKKQMFFGKQYTTKIRNGLYNVYPIYDWRTKDDWIYVQKTECEYNKLYDRMHQAGLTIHQMRICQPYGDDQKRGLWLFHIIEPETWAKVVARVNGANQGALYCQDSGNIMGMHKVTLPPGHTWESFSYLLLSSMPKQTREHFENKIAVFINWYSFRGYERGIPDDGPLDKSKPSWKRICKVLLRNDYWCKGLSFSQTTPKNYEKYKKIMQKRRKQWNLEKIG